MAARMSRGQAVVTIAAGVVGAYVSFRWNSPVVFLRVLISAAYIGRLAFSESAAGKLRRLLLASDYRVCTKCRYRPIGLAPSGRCPGCGNDFEIEQVREYWMETQRKQ